MGMVDQTVTRFGRIDILVNSVGAGEVMADLIVDSEVAFGVKKWVRC
jgi:NAD(P)-dependent dehydrogenase (short-subunit alcohol dehydrogenase family)